MKNLAKLLILFFLSFPVLAEDKGVSLNGSMEVDLFGRTNNTSPGGDAGMTTAMEVAITVNVDGKHETDVGYFVWRVAQKVATDWRFDKLGEREAWGGIENEKYGTLRVGNQFSNLYLLMDGPFSAGGMGNFFSDVGAHEVQYHRSINYMSPEFWGLTVKLQGDIGGSTSVTRGETDPINDREALKATPYSGAFEALLEYKVSSMAFYLGGYYGKNNGTLDFWADAFNGTRTSPGSGSTECEFNNDPNLMLKCNGENRAYVGLAGMTMTMGNFDVATAFKTNVYKGQVFVKDVKVLSELNGVDGKAQNYHGMVKLGYTQGQNNYSLGFQRVSPTSDNSTVYAAGVNSYHFQYNRVVAPSAVLFFQARWAQYGKEIGALDVKSQFSADGVADGKKDAARLLLGLWVGF